MALIDRSELDRILASGIEVMEKQNVKPRVIRCVQHGVVPDEAIAHEIINIMRTLMEKSEGKLPPQLIAPAGVALCIELAHSVREIAKVDFQMLTTACTKTVLGLAKSFGVLDALKKKRELDDLLAGMAAPSWLM